MSTVYGHTRTVETLSASVVMVWRWDLKRYEVVQKFPQSPDTYETRKAKQS
jgi:hypothetical protein